MEYAVLGMPADGPTLDLDHREFAYAGKFVMSDTGKAVVRSGGEILGAVAFNEDRSDTSTAKIRYVTVRADRQGEGIGAQLLRFSAEKLQKRGYQAVVIAVNNPIAYRAAYRAGFGATGEQTGIAEVLLEYDPKERLEDEFHAGLQAFRDRDLPANQEACLRKMQDSDLPATVDAPE